MSRAETFLAREESPNPKRIVRRDAVRITDELLRVLRHTQRPYALFIGANLEFLMTPRYGKRYEKWCERWPKSLCGVYTPEATAIDVIDDILGMDA